jgi:hypothetical protein
MSGLRLIAADLFQIASQDRKKSVLRRHADETNVVRTDSLPWLRRQFSSNTHYFKDIRVHRNSVMYRGASLNLRKYRLRASSCPDIYTNSMITLAKDNEQVLHRLYAIKCNLMLFNAHMNRNISHDLLIPDSLVLIFGSTNS